jgi:membrane protease YdiL (CAAX protease family)
VRTVKAESGREPSSKATWPGAPVRDPRVLGEEVMVVLSLSLLASAVFAIRDLLRAPVNKTVARAVISQAPLFVDQILPILFALPPVWLVFYLVRRNGEGAAAIGLDWREPGRDTARALAIAAIVGAAGIFAYVFAVRSGFNRFVVPIPPRGFWWTYPILVLSAAQNALLEETVVLGYLVTRLRQIGWSGPVAVGASALLRGSYHLYQGWGGFAGNVVMGLFFGWLFLRWKRAWPMVLAHTVIDFGAGVLYILYNDQLLHLLRIT